MIELDPDVLAFAGDWHGNTMFAVSTIYRLKREGVSHIIHLGDFGYRFEFEFRDRLEQALADTDIMLYFVDGNHDWHGWIWNQPEDDNGFYVISPHIKAIPRGHRFGVWGLTFMGLGGATSVDKDWRTQEGPRAEWWATETITPMQALTAMEGGEADVMVCHDAPSGIPIPGISYEKGIKFFPHHSLMEADRHRDVIRHVVNVVRPKLLVHGHYHVDYEYLEAYTGMRVVGKDMDGTPLHMNIMLAHSVFDLIGHTLDD